MSADGARVSPVIQGDKAASVAALFHANAKGFYDLVEELSQSSVKAKADAAKKQQDSRSHNRAGGASSAPRHGGDAGGQPSYLGRYRERIQRLHDMAVVVLMDQEKEEQQERLRLVAENDIKLGKVVTQSLGGDLWVDGDEPREIQRRLNDIERRRKDVREHSKEIRTATNAATASTPDAEDLPDPQVLLEINRRRLDLFRRQEQELQASLTEFNAQKALHIKEFRRMREERRSHFSKHPVLDNGRYLVLSMLGKGGFSEVWRACDLETCRMVAIKVHQCQSTCAEKKAQYLRHAWREFEIQQRFRHPRVVSLLDCFELDTRDSFCTILPYSPHGDLDSFLKKHRDLPEATARPLIGQILSGLAYLHSMKVIHYDLKPANVLFFSPSEVKLTDFGLSKTTHGTPRGANGEETSIELTSQGAGTYWYLPPECFETQFTPKVTAKVDIWAAGVVFYQMLFGRRPYGHDSSQKQLFTNMIILNAKPVEFPAKPKVSEPCKAIIRACLTRDVSQRPSAAELLTDPYFFQTTVGPGAKRMQQRAAAAAASASASAKRPRALLSEEGKGGKGGGGGEETASNGGGSNHPMAPPAAQPLSKRQRK